MPERIGLARLQIAWHRKKTPSVLALKEWSLRQTSSQALRARENAGPPATIGLARRVGEVRQIFLAHEVGGMTAMTQRRGPDLRRPPLKVDRDRQVEIRRIERDRQRIIARLSQHRTHTRRVPVERQHRHRTLLSARPLTIISPPWLSAVPFNSGS